MKINKIIKGFWDTYHCWSRGRGDRTCMAEASSGPGPGWRPPPGRSATPRADSHPPATTTTTSTSTTTTTTTTAITTKTFQQQDVNSMLVTHTVHVRKYIL